MGTWLAVTACDACHAAFLPFLLPSSSPPLALPAAAASAFSSACTMLSCTLHAVPSGAAHNAANHCLSYFALHIPCRLPAHRILHHPVLPLPLRSVPAIAFSADICSVVSRFGVDSVQLTVCLHSFLAFRGAAFGDAHIFITAAGTDL